MTWFTWPIGATTLFGTALAMLPSVAAAGSAAPPPLAVGHAEVIAQGLVDFPDGTFHWQVADGSLAAGADPTAVPEAVTFVLADDGVVDVAGTVASYRLGAGEAVMLPTLSTAVLSTAGDSATYWTLSIANVTQTGGAGAAGGSFSLDAALRDVDLLRDVLVTGESLTIPDQDVATLLLVTSGTVGATSDGGALMVLADGDAATLDGELTITNDGDEDATVVAAVIGPTLPALEQAPQPTTPVTTPLPPPNPSGTTTPAPTTAGGTSSTMPPGDSDGDGLSDVDETGIYGTDPNNPDSEGDHVMDGDEINVYGTDPLDNDSDDDFATDGDEVNILGTNPTVADTDGDGLIDSNENPHGADPNVADTDGDGFNDGTEVASGTNPADATSHP